MGNSVRNNPSIGTVMSTRGGSYKWDGKQYVSAARFNAEFPTKKSPAQPKAPVPAPTPSTVVSLSTTAPTESLTYAKPSLVAATAITGGPRAPSFGQPSPGQTAPSTPATATQAQPGGPRAPSFGQPTPGYAGTGDASSLKNALNTQVPGAPKGYTLGNVLADATGAAVGAVVEGVSGNAPAAVTAGIAAGAFANSGISGFANSPNPPEHSDTYSSGGESSTGRSIADHQTGFGGGEGGAVSSGGQSSAGRSIADHQTGFGGSEGGDGGGGDGGGGGGDGGGGD